MISKTEEQTEMEQKGIELNEDYAVIFLPTEAVEVIISAKVYHEGEILSVHRNLNMKDVQEAFRRGEDYWPPDATFSLNEGVDCYNE